MSEKQIVDETIHENDVVNSGREEYVVTKYRKDTRLVTLQVRGQAWRTPLTFPLKSLQEDGVFYVERGPVAVLIGKPKLIISCVMEWASRGREPNSVCEVAIFEGRGEEAGKKVIILTEPENNPGMSVTNGVEKIATQVLRQNSLHHLDAVFVEHYPKSAMHPDGETWDLVTLTWDCQGNAYRSPEWKHANWETVAPMIGASSREEIEI